MPTTLPQSSAAPRHCFLFCSPGAGGWGPWGPWSSCSRSCGGGLRSRSRACDQPPPQGLGDYCEGPRAQGAACQALPCPGTCQGRRWGSRRRGGKAVGGILGRRAGRWRGVRLNRTAVNPPGCPPPPTPLLRSDQLHRHRRGGVQRLWPSLPSLLR